MSIYLITQLLFIPENNKVFPKKFASANNSSITLLLISTLTHILLYTYAGSQAPISRLGGGPK